MSGANAGWECGQQPQCSGKLSMLEGHARIALYIGRGSRWRFWCIEKRVSSQSKSQGPSIEDKLGRSRQAEPEACNSSSRCSVVLSRES